MLYEQENKDYVICPICNKHMKQITNTHLNKHNINIEKFIKQYPTQPFMCENLLNKKIYAGKCTNNKKIGLENKQNNIIEYDNQPIHCLECGTKIEYNNRINKFCNKQCSAKYNNKKRIDCGYLMNSEIKQKIKNKIFERYYIIDENGKVIKKYTNIKYYKCVNCEKTFIQKNISGFVYKYCSKKCRHIILSKRAKENNKLNKNNNKKSWGWYDSPIAGKVHLDSSWEYKVAKSLDENNIKWIRPSKDFYTFEWIDSNGNNHLYYPDFYLVEYDIYLDPKQPFLQIKDKYKIEYVVKKYNLKLLILNKNDLYWEMIKKLIERCREPSSEGTSFVNWHNTVGATPIDSTKGRLV